ncbi:Oligoribonuclease [Neolecta irregularis DAH-3]|uniref:Oligoribonuclease n=1 Tax=Neolecta irregularis (strain DAH-3) TaxID=1198029 RepID=A0A1U7LHK0_NEOID|nr:Oligoribonuclease [Neolecta irregularis DAH-3]|eukprot:OLL22127.1 Oligoribonuclease [Neolecta irregularis DAH-3]
MLERLRLVRVRVPRLHRSTASLVWVDCETTGLSPRNDHMLQVAALVTDNDLNPLHNVRFPSSPVLIVQDGFQETIYQPPQVLAQMDSWCTAQHTGSGLVAAAQNSTHTVEQTEMRLLEYVQQYVTSPKKGLLCGYSVHFDRAFLEVHMPRFAAYLSHRSIGARIYPIHP